jgi:putative membrane protein
MKKLMIWTALLCGFALFQACNNSGANKDSVEAAQDSNDAMNTTMEEDDSDFMVKAANGGMMEVEAGNLAVEKAATESVRTFAARMVADHTLAGEELKALAEAKTIALPTELAKDEKDHLNDMGKKTGTEFDKHYVDMMVNDHDKTVSMFEDAAQNAKDPEVRAWAAKTLPTLKEHQALVKALKEKF